MWHKADAILLGRPLSCRQLVSLQQKLAVMQADPDHTLAEVLPLQEQLDMIDAERWAGGRAGGGCGCGASLPSPLCNHTSHLAWPLMRQLNCAMQCNAMQCNAMQCNAMHPSRLAACRLSKGGSWGSGAAGGEAPGEAACNEALNRCYELLASCMRSAEDVALEMKASSVASPRGPLRRSREAPVRRGRCGAPALHCLWHVLPLPRMS